MAVKRTRFLGIRVTDGEYQQLLVLPIGHPDT